MDDRTDREITDSLIEWDRVGMLATVLDGMTVEERDRVDGAVARERLRSERELVRTWRAMSPASRRAIEAPAAASWHWPDVAHTDIENYANNPTGER